MSDNLFAKKILYMEIGGFFFIIAAGALLHFVYEWSGSNPVAGMFAPVNESVWEHLKLGYFSLFIFAIFEYASIKDISQNFFTAKLSGVITQELIIVIFHYAYRYFTGSPILFIDISLFVIGAAACQFISYSLLASENNVPGLESISLILIAAHTILFFIFTYYPPNVELFIDHSRTSM